MALPSLPSGGPLRLLAISGSVAIFGFLAVSIAELLARRFAAAAWAFAPLFLAAATILAARVSALLHLVLALVTLGLTLRNVMKLEHWRRVVEAIAALAWMVALLSARALFH